MVKAIVTSGATKERIDPVRYISNDSSGKQGHAIAYALAKRNVDVTLISGMVNIPDPEGVKVIKIESAIQMLQAVEANLPADIFIAAAAVCDWQPEFQAQQKIKKQSGEDYLNIKFIKTPDILNIVSNHKNRPKIVVGFAAETENLIENAKKKLINKGCDYILANDVSGDVFGGDENKISLIYNTGVDIWDKMPKTQVAEKLANLLLNFS
jgi:phosphopantothenoylcysteine decarboxylase/phosphopantothenate--cysteine ligase